MNASVRHWAGQTVWLIGASTGIGRATAHRLHELGAQVMVSARDGHALAAFVATHPGSRALPLDVTDVDQVQAVARQVLADTPGPLRVVYCAGFYQPMRATTWDSDGLRRHWQVNYEAVLTVLGAVLPTLLQRRQGHISLVGSVAGYRGLPNSLAYGPTKAALINLAEVLYQDLRHTGVEVSLVNPGFVDTPMTAINDFRMPGLITPEQAALALVQGWEHGQFEIHFPRRFTWWLKLLRVLPLSLYFPLIHKVTGL